VKKNKQVFLIDNPSSFKVQLLHWSNQFEVCTFLDNHAYNSSYGALDCIAAAGPLAFISLDQVNAIAVNEFIQTHSGEWIFAHFNYEYHSITKPNTKVNLTGFPLAYLYTPAVVIELTENKVTIQTDSDHPQIIFDQVSGFKLPSLSEQGNEQQSYQSAVPTTSITPLISKASYLENIHKILALIRRGDFYEINYCQAFEVEHLSAHPVNVYANLTDISPTPFACFYKNSSDYLLCASPERYLQKKGNQLISQPIKGTIKRNVENDADDKLQVEALKNSSKDKSENVMVVDLVRNDLSRICEQGSVEVSELFGIYSFPQVHQMISTITGKLASNTLFSEILEATFPMGSMTGAPKKSVMETIDTLEPTKRGLYSGTVGYLNPAGDFDFNVVIRSIFYNSDTQKASYGVGGGITIYSDPEKEYEECLLKAAAIKKVLSHHDNATDERLQ
jgi:para-aminobenzoate synthetase component 1